MNLIDIRYIRSFKPTCEFNGDFDGGNYTINLDYKEKYSVHEKLEYTLSPEDYKYLIDGMEYFLKILKKIKG